jgi:N-sulfoglucosamine sulfohydrolase
LEAIGLANPGPMDGASFAPLLRGETQAGRERVFTQFHMTVKEEAFPMRCVQDKRYCYIFNAWSDGERQFKAESMSGLTFKAMQKAAETDPAIAARVALYLKRVPEELYDLQADPDCLTNLASRPDERGALDLMRGTLRNWMAQTGDEALGCFDNRGVCGELVDGLGGGHGKKKRKKKKKKASRQKKRRNQRTAV